MTYQVFDDREKLEKELAELQKKYDELNDFSNSQLRKALIENEVLKKKSHDYAVYATDKIAELESQLEEIKSGTMLKELTEKCRRQAELIEKMKHCKSCINFGVIKKNNDVSMVCARHNETVLPDAVCNCWESD